jgi:uncharacterized membrane protein
MEIAIVAIVSVLIQVCLHWFPWRPALGKELPRVSAYILGVAGMMIPFSVLLVVWNEWMTLIGLWVVILASGLAVVLVYAIDSLLAARNRAAIAEKEGEVLRAENE